MFIYFILFFFFCIVLYHLFIPIIRIRYIYKILNSDKLNIKISALDQLVRLSVSIRGKGIPQQVDVAMGIMLGVDIALKKAEHKTIFARILGSAFKTI